MNSLQWSVLYVSHGVGKLENRCSQQSHNIVGIFIADYCLCMRLSFTFTLIHIQTGDNCNSFRLQKYGAESPLTELYHSLSTSSFFCKPCRNQYENCLIKSSYGIVSRITPKIRNLYLLVKSNLEWLKISILSKFISAITTFEGRERLWVPEQSNSI